MKLRMFMAGLLLAAPLHWVPAAAQPAEQDAAYIERYEAGLEIAKAGQPADLLAEQTAMGFRFGFNQAREGDPNLLMMEAEYPGLLDKFADEGAAIMVASVNRRLPDLWSDLANLYARELELEEIRSMAAFYSSPTGQKFIAAMNRGVDMQALTDRIIEDGGVSADVNLDFTMQAGGAALSKMDADELAKMQAFTAAHGPELMRLTPMAMAISTRWINTPIPAADQSAMQAAMAKLMAEHGEAGASGK